MALSGFEIPTQSPLYPIDLQGVWIRREARYGRRILPLPFNSPAEGGSTQDLTRWDQVRDPSLIGEQPLLPVLGALESSRGLGLPTFQEMTSFVTAGFENFTVLARLTPGANSSMVRDLRTSVSSPTSKSFTQTNPAHVPDSLSISSLLTLITKITPYHVTDSSSSHSSLLTLDKNPFYFLHISILLSHLGSIDSLNETVLRGLGSLANAVGTVSTDGTVLLVGYVGYVGSAGDDRVVDLGKWISRLGGSVNSPSAVLFSSVRSNRYKINRSKIIWTKIYESTPAPQQTTNQRKKVRIEVKSEIIFPNVVENNSIGNVTEHRIVNIITTSDTNIGYLKIVEDKEISTEETVDLKQGVATKKKMSSSEKKPTDPCSQRQDQVQQADPILNPPSFRSFACASPSRESSTVGDAAPGAAGVDLSSGHPTSGPADGSASLGSLLAPTESESDLLPCRDLTEPLQSTKNTNADHEEFEDNGGRAKGPEEHLCLSSSGSRAPSRHDSIKSPIDTDVDHDTSASEGLETFGRSGVVLDKENEGDREVLTHLASRTSNITDDLDQLHPGQSSPEAIPDSPSTIDVNGQGQLGDVGTLEKVTDPGHESIISENIKISVVKLDINIESAKIAAPVVSANMETVTPDAEIDKIDKKQSEIQNDDDPDDIKERTRIEQERYDRCMQEHDEFYRLEDERLAKLPSPDTSGSFDPPEDRDEGGRAGLDPDHSSLWGPEFINTSVNLSKSKKRRRRQQKNKDKLQGQDSLSKLLHGKQTKEEEERISTYDLGNQRSGQDGKDLDTSGIYSGNLEQKRQKTIKECNKEKDFVATLNSTRYGPDFDQDSTNSHSFLRGDSEDGKLRQEDLEAHKDVDDGEAEASNEGINDNPEADDEKNEQDKESSNNSTNGKRKRKRGKKTNNNAKLPKQDQQQPTADSKGRETRSKTQGKTGPVVEEATGSKGKDHEAPKGEKEKHPGPEPFAIATAQQSQLSVFKQPSCSRSELRRLVAKAVRKPKPKISNNFALNSKIEYFKISTDSAHVKKIPVIDEEAPLVEMAIPEFIWPEHDRTIEEDNLVNVKSRGVIPFIVLIRSCHVPNDPWDAPGIDKVRDFASYMSCQIAEHNLEFGTVLRWTNPWGNVAVMGLDSSDLGLLLRFRTFLTTLRYVHQFFNTFPKDAMTESLGISIILKSDLREFQEKYLAEALFARNDLSGVLDTLQSETFTASDKTRAGVSKNGWRNVQLEGDSVFLQSLSKFTALHWFPIGPASVQIHGGERRAETEAEIEAKNKRRRFNMPAGQHLTEAARASINKSFLTDQEKLARNLIVPANAPAAQSGANRAPLGKKKR